MSFEHSFAFVYILPVVIVVATFIFIEFPK